MNHDWDAEQVLTEHFDAPIRLYLHERSVDLENIKIHIDNRVHGIDSDGARHSLHKDDILFAFPLDKMPYVRPHITMLNRVKSLRLNRKSNAQNRFCIDDSKLTTAIQKNIVLVTRRGHVIRGELQAFDKLHLFMRVGSKVVLVYRQGLFAFKTKVNDLRKLHKKRKKWVEANRENNFEDGIKQLLTELYPDNAHFIYELLQNAEDAGASEVKFVLKEDSATFEHNGDRIFSPKDVDAITSIGFSTKRDDHTSIGKFGIGFKAVFAYTTTPEIESGEFHFRIRDMVVPDTGGLAPGSLGWGKTHFVFPFGNPKKPPEKACEEIETNLRELNENTLLFLSNIRKIEYRLPDSTTGSLERRESTTNRNRIEISVMRPENPLPDSIHYLRFTKDVDVQNEEGQLKRCQISVAFGTDKSRKITPLNQGQVCIYFPAVKETSKLRFHLHAPFASTVARDSVRECPANEELRNHLAELIAESMHTIRDQGLLDVEFLATLPNNRDDLRPFYLPIQERLIEEFNTEKLTPVKRRRSEHAAASGTYRGSNVLSALINDEDLATLFGKDRDQPLWIANPQQRNQREDNFLSKLDITQWEIEDFIEILETQSDAVKEWLKEKPNDWHQDLYVLLGDFLKVPASQFYMEGGRKERLSNLRIVRCNDGEYRTSSECHFLDDVEFEVGKEKAQSEEFHYVAKGIYSSGQNKNRQQKAREFLEKIGVCEVDEAEHIKVILRQRYEDPYTIIPSELHEEDMKRFIALVEKEPDRVDLFKNYRIFKTVDCGSFDEGFYHNASIIFLDSPYLETGLKVYYEDDEYWEYVCTESLDPYLSLDHKEYDLDLEKLGKFAEALGAKTKLEANKQIIPEDHPEWNNRLGLGSGHWRHTGVDEDYRIPEFQILLTNPSIAKAKLFWQAMCSLPERSLKARFRWNQSNELHEANSTLVHELRNAKWVPQKNGNSISFLRPRDAVRDNLPAGFPYDTGQKWLEAIEFGKTAKQQRTENIIREIEQNSRNQHAKEFGFDSADEANTMAKIANELKEEGKTPDELLKQRLAQKRRKELLIIELSDAEEKEYEIRARSIRSTGNTIDPSTTLRALYTTDEDRMHCQMCSKGMPFKKRNSDEDYFEAVEALGKGYFFKEHEAQYLALCPECAAEYKEYVKRDPKARKTFHDALKNSDNPQIHLVSNGRNIRIWFETKHWWDLKAVLYYYENIYDPDDAD
ncbi:hypothetical protein F4X10_12400 [Candidatus Poribacteria bacterium]|nr:hypothetical protein [Candidatus Poribacteria bacterium]